MEQIRITPERKADLQNLLLRLADNMIPFEYIYDVHHNIYINGYCNSVRHIVDEHAINCIIFVL